MRWQALSLAALIAVGAAAPAWTQARSAPPGGSVAGQVVDETGAPVTDAVVSLIELRRRAETDAQGEFRFEGVPAGSHYLQVESPRAGTAVETIEVTSGEETRLQVTVDVAVHHEEIVVSAGPGTRGLEDIAQAADVIEGEQLEVRLQPTLGETLAQETGVHSTYFGPGASRPIIRGLGGDRIRVLESGIGSGDASSTSPDHAVSTDPLSAERIEILRGPATLLYGSSAIGGVVNVIDGRIPDYVPERPVTGSVELRGGTVADERSGAITLDGGFDQLAWHLEGLKRKTDDYEIPGFAVHEHEEEEGHEEEEEPVFGVLENSALESEGGSAGLSWVADAGFVGVSVTGYDTLYGIPSGAHEHHDEEGEHGEEEQEEEEHAGVRVDLQQQRLDLRGEVNRSFGAFEGLKLRWGRTDYEHRELEGAEVGTLFTNESWEGRLEAPHGEVGAFRGAIGLQAASRDFSAIGEEAFVPPTETDSWALFLFEELGEGPFKLQIGARYETQDVVAQTSAPNDRSFSGVSGSLGFIWLPVDDWSLALSLARSNKLPNAEELFSNGPHVATNAFEIGDPNLDEETSLGTDLSLRKGGEGWRGELNVFLNRFDDYIFEELTGEEMDGLQVVRYVQRDAEFRGAELHLDFDLLHTHPHHLALEVQGDYVEAELRDGGQPLPRIPALRYGAGLRYRGDRLGVGARVTRTDEQDEVAPFEEPSAGYTMVDADASYRLFAGTTVHDLVLRGTNLTDEEARVHTSFLKEVAPLPGRDVSLMYRLTF
jgi:iron complex outermembrane receptor protein